MTVRSHVPYPRARMDALSDGIFAVAMTLLVLDVRLPEGFQPHSRGELLAALVDLWPKFLPYLLSFYVLGARWLAGVDLRSKTEGYSRQYVRWWQFYLLLITIVPFTTMLVGRYASLAPAIWVYAGNTALIALTSWRLITLTPELEHEHHRRTRMVGQWVLLASALLCIALSFVNSAESLFALLLNLATPLFNRRVHDGGSR